jgi:hypothetical protein
VAPQSGSNLTIRKFDLGLLLVSCRTFASNSHRFRVIIAFSFWKNRPEAEIDSRWRRIPEIVSQFDRPTEDGTFVSLCFTRLSAAVCEFLRVLWFSRFLPEVVSGTGGVASRKWRHHSISRPHFCISGLLTSFVYLFPFKSYSTFSFRLEISIRRRNFGRVLGFLDPLMHAYINEIPKNHVLASNRVVWAIMHVCATLRSAATRLREKIQQKNITCQRDSARQCCKGHVSFLWEKPIFDPSQKPNPLSYNHKSLHDSLRWWSKPMCKLPLQSVG